MKKDKIVVGLDIGTTKICIVVAKELDKNKIEVIAKGEVESNGVSNGEVLNIVDTSNDIKKAVEKIEKSSGFRIKKVLVGIAGQNIRSTSMPMSYIRDKERRDSLIDINDIKKLEEQIQNITTNKPGEQIITYLPQEYFVDNEPCLNNNPIGMIGSKIDVTWHVVIGNTNPYNNICKAVDLAGLEIADVELEPIASSKAVLTQEQLDNGVCLIDIGGGTTDVAVFSDGIIRHTAIIPYAGNYITDKIRDSFRIAKKTAKYLKESNETCSFYSHIPQNVSLTIANAGGLPASRINKYEYNKAINTLLTNILNAVKGQLRISSYSDKLNAGVVITGGGANIKLLEALATQCLGISTSIGKPTPYLKNMIDKSLDDTKYSTAIGLALLACEKVNESMVVSKEEILSQKFKEEQLETKSVQNNETKIQHKNDAFSFLKNKYEKLKYSLLLDTENVNDFEK